MNYDTVSPTSCVYCWFVVGWIRYIISIYVVISSIVGKVSLTPPLVRVASPLTGILYAYPALGLHRPSATSLSTATVDVSSSPITTSPPAIFCPPSQPLPAAITFPPALTYWQSSLIGCAHCGNAHTIIDIPVEVSLCRRSRCRLLCEVIFCSRTSLDSVCVLDTEETPKRMHRNFHYVPSPLALLQTATD